MGTYSDLLFGPADGGLVEPVQAPIERPAPVVRPGSALPRSRPPSVAAPPVADAVPKDVYLPPAEFEKLSKPDQEAYIRQRNDWLDYKQERGRFARQPPPSPAPAAPTPQAPVAAPEPAAPLPRYSDELFGPTEPVPAPMPKPAAPAVPAPEAEPDASSWIGRRAQDVLGKHDRRYKDLPTIAEALKAEGNMGIGTAGREMWGWLVGASDKDMAGVFQGILGPRFIRTEQDANGYPIVVYRGQDGAEQKAYVNKPGLDMQDVVRGVTGIAPNIGAARLVSGAMRGSNLLGRMVGQAMGQGAASVAQDVAGVVTGVSDTDLERSATKAGLSAAGGAAGELIAAPLAYAWRKLVTEPRYFNRATGELTEEGIKAAEAAGLDPATLTRQAADDFASAIARSGNPRVASKQSFSNEFRIPRTQGELTGRKADLIREQNMQGGAYGESAARSMEGFRKRQGEAIEDAVRGMADEMAPARAGTRLGKDELGANIRANTQSAYDTAKEFENKAWKDLQPFRASDEMLAHLDEAIPQGLKQRGVTVIEEGLTPAAKKMSDMLESFQAGEMPKTASKYVGSDIVGQVDLMRRRLLAAMEDAATPTDKRATKALYDSFNDWVLDAARMSGDASIATQMRTARAISRQVHEVFDGVKGTAGERILGSVLKKADSAEGIVDALFSGQTRAQVKSGSIDALKRLKEAYTRFLEPEAAKAAMDDLKLAYFMRMVEDKAGRVMEPRALSSSLKNALASQRSVLTALGVTKEEMARMGRLASLLEDVARRNPNTSWSGVTMSAFMRDIGNALMSMLGANNVLVRAAAGPAIKPFQEAYGRALVGRATGGGQGAAAPRLLPPPIAGPAAGIAGSDR